jgi:septal ring factor EnvC (AmiA/AmiB activator)
MVFVSTFVALLYILSIVFHKIKDDMDRMDDELQTSRETVQQLKKQLEQSNQSFMELKQNISQVITEQRFNDWSFNSGFESKVKTVLDSFAKL